VGVGVVVAVVVIVRRVVLEEGLCRQARHMYRGALMVIWIGFDEVQMVDGLDAPEKLL
jgi:hypothetical protein